ncbi:hypothetical protein RJT34_14795 [Clitoria ternatea]|uniref:Uncharacterized protein n=1 Tax=Clitoria ternatea TaxID=43366 RepID=A0AAN9JTX5_CLITE
MGQSHIPLVLSHHATNLKHVSSSCTLHFLLLSHSSSSPQHSLSVPPRFSVLRYLDSSLFIGLEHLISNFCYSSVLLIE